MRCAVNLCLVSLRRSRESDLLKVWLRLSESPPVISRWLNKSKSGCWRAFSHLIRAWKWALAISGFFVNVARRPVTLAQCISINVYLLLSRMAVNKQSDGARLQTSEQTGRIWTDSWAARSEIFSNKNLTSNFPNVTFLILFIQTFFFFFCTTAGQWLTFKSGSSGGTRLHEGVRWRLSFHFRLFWTFISSASVSLPNILRLHKTALVEYLCLYWVQGKSPGIQSRTQKHSSHASCYKWGNTVLINDKEWELIKLHFSSRATSWPWKSLWWWRKEHRKKL